MDRDQIAMHIMPNVFEQVCKTGLTQKEKIAATAVICYELADAMIAQSNK